MKSNEKRQDQEKQRLHDQTFQLKQHQNEFISQLNETWQLDIQDQEISLFDLGNLIEDKRKNEYTQIRLIEQAYNSHLSVLNTLVNTTFLEKSNQLLRLGMIIHHLRRKIKQQDMNRSINNQSIISNLSFIKGDTKSRNPLLSNSYNYQSKIDHMARRLNRKAEPSMVTESSPKMDDQLVSQLKDTFCTYFKTTVNNQNRKFLSIVYQLKNKER